MLGRFGSGTFNRSGLHEFGLARLAASHAARKAEGGGDGSPRYGTTVLNGKRTKVAYHLSDEYNAELDAEDAIDADAEPEPLPRYIATTPATISQLERRSSNLSSRIDKLADSMHVPAALSPQRIRQLLAGHPSGAAALRQFNAEQVNLDAMARETGLSATRLREILSSHPGGRAVLQGLAS